MRQRARPADGEGHADDRATTRQHHPFGEHLRDQAPAAGSDANRRRWSATIARAVALGCIGGSAPSCPASVLISACACAAVTPGFRRNASEVIREGHRLLKEHDDVRLKWREQIERGWLQAQAGKVVDGDQVFRKVDERIKQRGRKRAG